MFVLDMVLSYYKCAVCLDKNSQLLDLYEDTMMNSNSKDLNYYNYFDYELEDFLLHLVDKTDNLFDNEFTACMNSLISGYPRLSDLVEYMHKVNFLKPMHDKMLEETYLKLPFIHDCFLPDSRVKDLLFDNKNHICIMNLVEVSLLNDMRRNKSIMVDSGEITLIFNNVQNVKVKGELLLDCFKTAKVYFSHVMRASKDLIIFCIFVLVSWNRYFMLEISCSDIEVKML